MTKPINYQTSLEKKLINVPSPFEIFVDIQKTAGIILMFCLFISLVLGNNDLTASFFEKIINTPIELHVSSYKISFVFRTFVNDFLMVLFFLILGFEIKREFVAGELKQLKRANLVLMGASGGSFFSIISYIVINYYSGVYLQGWAIPMATDTAIVIGLLSFFKKRLPPGVFPFVTALAVIDDIIAVMVIAVFYTDHINYVYLTYAGACFVFMLSANFIGIRRAWFYFIMGAGLWIGLELSEIHGAIAGIIVAFTIPARPHDAPHVLVKKIKRLLRVFEEKHQAHKHILKDETEHEILEEITEKSLQATTPLKRWKRVFQQPVFMIILPLFALINSNLSIDATELAQTLQSPMFWGIFLGLSLAKPLGIYAFIWGGVRYRVGELPSGVLLKDIRPICLLAGVGYTMSIFITDVAFSNYELMNMAKISVMITSVVVAMLSIFFLFLKTKKETGNPRSVLFVNRIVL